MISVVANDDLGKLQRAVRWAAKQHKGQDRDGPTPLPYITHPVDVMNALRYRAKNEDEDILAAAALHDVIEECGVPLSTIEEKFGKRTAKLVSEMTRREPSDEKTAKMTEGQIAELRNKMLLEDIAKMGHDAWLIKLADRLSNLQGALATRTGEKLDRYIRQSEEILLIIPRSVSPPLWDGIKELLSKTSAAQPKRKNT